MQQHIINRSIALPGTTEHSKKILFATFPADGHFNPLTGLGVYLQSLGYDVRWYTSVTYSEKLKKLGIHHYAFKKSKRSDQQQF